MPPPVATYVTEIDWDNNGNFSGNYDNISSRFIEANWRRGRNNNTQVAGRSDPGTFTATFRNDDGFFSEFNANSPVKDLIDVSLPINFRTTAPIATNQWNGYVADIRLSSQHDQSKIAIVTGVGPLSFLNGVEVHTQMFTEALRGVPITPGYAMTAIGGLFDAANWPPSKYDIDDGNTVMNRWYVAEENIVDALHDLEAADAGFVSETRDGKIKFANRYARLTDAVSVISQATWSDREFSPISYRTIVPGGPRRDIYNKILADVTKYSIGSPATLWSHPEVGTPDLFYVLHQDYGVMSILAFFPNPDTNLGADSVDVWNTTPVYTLNSAPNGSGTDLSGWLTALPDVDNKARRATLELYQAGIAVPPLPPTTAYFTQLDVIGTPVYKLHTTKVEQSDAASISKHGVRSYPIPTKWLPSTEFANRYAYYLLSRYAAQRKTVQVTMRGNTNESTLIEVLTRDISDRVTIQGDSFVHLGARLGLNDDFFVESITSHVGVDRVQDTTFECSLASNEDYWRLGYSKLCDTTKLML